MDSKLSFSNGKSAEMGIVDRTMSEGPGTVGGMDMTIKRDLRRRHINMIAIAGMIVSEAEHIILTPQSTMLTNTRERVSS
jgi:amino acid permease